MGNYSEDRELEQLDYVYEPEKPEENPKKSGLTIPKSSAFSEMMRQEMGAIEEVSAPRLLKGDEYKEFMLDNEEEKKSANVPLKKAHPKAKAEPTVSWRNMGKKVTPAD